MIKLFKGCLFKIIILIIVVAGTGYYIYVNYGSKIAEGAKKEALGWMTSEIDDKISELNETDSNELKAEFEKYITELSKKDFSEAIDEVDKLSEYFSSVLSDKQLNAEEIDKLKQLLRTNEKQ